MTKSESKPSTEYGELLDEVCNYQSLRDPFGYGLCDIMRKISRKEIEMKKTATDLPTPEEVTRITANLDLASKLDNAAIAKLSSSKSKNSTPKIGELCGMDLLLDLSSAPEEAKYELYFKARTILEDVIKKEEL